jgi:NADH dehydrogenase
MKVLVLGGRGFIGRYVVKALLDKHIDVVIGSRKATGGEIEIRRIALQQMHKADDWLEKIAEFDLVINCVGILRERLGETYQQIHNHAPYSLALACKALSIRLIHISALGLSANAQSRFILSKLEGENNLLGSGAQVVIVRPSLLDGIDGYGARWLRRVAQWPVHGVMKTEGLIAPLHVTELAEVIVKISLMPANQCPKVVELGGTQAMGMAEYLALLRSEYTDTRAPCVELPVWMIRIISHLLDVIGFTPLSFGHVELMQGYNVPAHNYLPQLLGRNPWVAGRKADLIAPFPVQAL